MLKILLPKEEKYFEDFNEMLLYLKEMAQINLNIFSSDDPNSNISKIKPLEVKCDEVTTRITNRLNSTFITPFDREDIFALIKRLDDIADLITVASGRIELFEINSKIEFANELSNIIFKQVEELQTAVRDLKSKKENTLERVRELETEADKIYLTAIKDLFKTEKDAIELIKKKEILEILEDICDRCQSAANVIFSIIIKNS